MHVQCDEMHPICVQCTTSMRRCLWELGLSHPTTRARTVVTAQSASTALASSITGTAFASPSDGYAGRIGHKFLIGQSVILALARVISARSF
jgi:hypothetical protein